MYHKCYEQQISAGKEKGKDMFENQPDLLNVKQCQQALQIGPMLCVGIDTYGAY